MARRPTLEALVQTLSDLTVTEFLTVVSEATGTKHRLAIVPEYEEDDCG